jgi:hypothetical protein
LSRGPPIWAKAEERDRRINSPRAGKLGERAGAKGVASIAADVKRYARAVAITHKSVIKTTFLLYHAAVSAIAGG